MMHAPTTTLHLNLLGCPELLCGEYPLRCSPMALRLLAVLALDGPTHRLHLADLLWDAPTERALHSLRMALHKLRRTLGEHVSVLSEKNSHLSLDLTRLHVDALHPSTTSSPPEFMSGHRTSGSESWLEWAREQEMKLVILTDSVPVTRSAWTPLTFQHEDTRPNDLAQQAQHALEAGEVVMAEKTARETLLKHPGTPSAALALNVLSNLVMDRGEYLRAYQYATEAVRISPEPNHIYTRAYLAGLLGEPSRGISMVQEGLRQLPAHVTPTRFYALLGNLQNAIGQIKAARYWHELSLQAAYVERDPILLTRVLSFMLVNLQVTGEHHRAELLANEGLEYGWHLHRIYLINSLGMAQLQQGKLEQALETFKHQMKSPNVTHVATAHSFAALTLHQMNEPDAARQALLDAQEYCQCTENGRVQYEWAVAALTLDPGHWHKEAQGMTQGRHSTDPLIVQKYQVLRQNLPPEAIREVKLLH